MKTRRQIFFRGPNLHAACSGLALLVDLQDEDAPATAWRPDEAEVRSVLVFLREALPAAAASAVFPQPGRIVGAALPFAELLLATAAVLVRDFCILPKLGRLMKADARELRFFIPCDERAVGQEAWKLSLLAAGAALSAPKGRAGQAGALLTKRYRDFVRDAARHSLGRNALALARVASKRGIPAYAIESGPSLQLGQGRYRRRIALTPDGRGAPGEEAMPATLSEAQAALDRWFPDGSAGRVPTVGVTGSVGKTTTCRMVAGILAAAGLEVALTTTQGAWIGARRFSESDVSGGGMARVLLRSPRVEAGVFEFARGGLIKRGMGLDAVDVAAVLNVYDNHIGVDGIRDRGDLARAKHILVRSARGMVVLNADDPLCLAMRESLPRSRLCLVGVRPDNPAMNEHVAAGGLAVRLDGEGPSAELRLLLDARLVGSMLATEIPASWRGTFRPAVYNALFATGIAHALGIAHKVIRGALAKFQSTEESNPGRMNFIEGLPYRLLVTWADGPEAMAELARFVRPLEVKGRKSVMLVGMGNRPDRYLMDMAKATAGVFDTYICSDWSELRGRPAGATARLLAQGLYESGIADDRVSIAATYDEALLAACRGAAANDLLVVVTYYGETAVQAARSIEA